MKEDKITYHESCEFALKSENYLLKINNESLRKSLHKCKDEVIEANKRFNIFSEQIKKASSSSVQTFNDMSYSIQISGKLSCLQVELLGYIFADKEIKIDRLQQQVERLNSKLIDLSDKKNISKKNLSTPKQTYLIKNKRNNLYKIGRSSNPLKREKTLQSEEPDIVMVKTWDKDIENELHTDYNNYRIRGEWFNLNEIQIRYICTKY